MAAAMAHAALPLDRLRLRDPRLLRQARQRVVLAENRDDRAAFTRLGHQRCRDPGHVLGHPEAFPIQHR